MGFFLITAIAYSTLSLDEAVKKGSQKQMLVSVSDYVASQLLGMMGRLPVGGTTSQTLRLPISRDIYSGQYSVRLEEVGGIAYVSVQSIKWPSMAARHPLFLNASRLSMSTTPVFPPAICPSISRNSTHYTISISC